MAAIVVVGAIAALTVSSYLIATGHIQLGQLKEWQTLTGAIFALIAASIAYRGATAKVRYDREVLAAENLRRRLALYLKLDIALRPFIEEARSLSAKFMFPPLENPQTIERQSLSISEPPEIEEAWTYLDLFPRETIAEIRRIRIGTRNISQLVRRWAPNDLIWHPHQEPPYPIGDIRNELEEMWQSAAIVVDVLGPMIKKMAPEMDGGRRDVVIYGEPGPDDLDD